MSLARTALRLQAIEALNSDPVIDALVQGRIYDSRIADFDHRELVPVIILTTEEDDAEAWSKNNGGAPFNHVCDLVLEIAMNAIATDDTGTVILQSGAPVIGSPATDRQLEAYLDLIEERAVDILTVGETPAALLLCEAVTRRVPKVKSSRFATDQTGEKLAVRLVTLRVEIKGEDPRDVRDALTGPFAALPDPLRTVAQNLPAGSSALKTCTMLAGALSRDAAEPFHGMYAVYAPQPLSPDVVPDRAADVAAGHTFAQTLDTPAWSA